LQAAAGTKRPEFWLHSGYKKRQPEAPVADAKSGQPRALDNKGLKGLFVELIGIEPTASRA
jgi:hypothetical protein